MATDKTEKRIKRQFSDEFKLEAIELGKKIGPSKAAFELGINESLIRQWRKKFEVQSPSSSNTKSFSELERENKRLIKENGYLKEINEVLKKSTAIFSQGHMRGWK